MLPIGTREEQVKIAMTENRMGALRAMPKKMLKKGAPCVKDAIESSDLLTKSCDLKWDKFWVRFKKFWMPSKKFAAIWSTHGNDENELGIHTRGRMDWRHELNSKSHKLEHSSISISRHVPGTTRNQMLCSLKLILLFCTFGQ